MPAACVSCGPSEQGFFGAQIWLEGVVVGEPTELTYNECVISTGISLSFFGGVG